MKEACVNCKSYSAGQCRLNPSPVNIESPSTYKCGSYKNVGLSAGQVSQNGFRSENKKDGRKLFFG